MGVKFRECPTCEQTYPDCGEFFECGNCNQCFCSDECGGRKIEKAGKSRWDDEVSCIYCRGEEAPDHVLIDFLLKRCGLTRKEAVQAMVPKKSEASSPTS